MANDNGTRSPDEIEREIERERSQLTDTLEEIQDRFSFESLSADVMDTVRGQSGDIARGVSRALKENPMAVALTAVGVGWMMMGPMRRRRSLGYDYREYADYDDDYDTAAFRRSPRAAVIGERYDSTARSASYSAEDWDEDWPEDWDEEHYVDEDETGEGRWDRAKSFFSDKAHAAADRAARARARASAGAASATDSAEATGSHGVHAASDRLKGGAGRVRGAGRRAYASAKDLGSRISEGTHDLGEEARRRVIAARRRAYEAQARAERYTRRGREKATDLFEDQPIVVGALALAIGAAIGGLVPGSRREDEAFGAYRDELFDEAERIYREERGKIGDVARATADEAKSAARDLGKELKSDAKHAANDAEKHVREATDRVAERARTEADDKGLGKV